MMCPTCGAAELVQDTRDTPYAYKGRTTVIRAVKGKYCPACGECVTDLKESGRVMREMTAFHKEVDASIVDSGTSRTIVKTRDGRELVMPSDEENEKIHAAALADPDAQPWTDEQLETALPSMRCGYSGRTPDRNAMDKQFIIKTLHTEAPATLHLTFADGATFSVDLSPIIAAHATLSRIGAPEVFAAVALVEGGCVVRWADDDDLELAADNLRARAIEQAGGYSHEYIQNWMTRHDLTLDAAAAAIGVSRRMLAHYRSGQKPVPRMVGLACLGWEVGDRG